MLLPILIILSFFCVNNAKRAQLRSLKPAAWAVYTAIAFLIGMFLSLLLLAMILMFKHPELMSLAQTNDRARMNTFLQNDFEQQGTLYGLLILSGAFGGFLLIRYLIDKKKIVE